MHGRWIGPRIAWLPSHMSTQPFPNERAFIIYKLIDPRCGSVRDIGQTDNPRRRRRDHTRQPIWSSNPEVALWKAELRGLGLQPRMEILESVDTPHELTEREQFWVKHFQREGADLLNLKLPGEGEHGLYREDPRSWNEVEYHLNCARDHLYRAAEMASHMHGSRSRPVSQVNGAIKKVIATREVFMVLRSQVLGGWSSPLRK